MQCLVCCPQCYPMTPYIIFGGHSYPLPNIELWDMPETDLGYFENFEVGVNTETVEPLDS